MDMNYNPARVVGRERHAYGGKYIWGCTARQVHAMNPEKLWCTKSGHWVHRSLFSGTFATCDQCRERNCATAARHRERERAENAQQQAAIQLDGQIPPQDHPQNAPLPFIPPNTPDAPPDPNSAIPPDDKILLENCRTRLMNIAVESCNFCHEEWFDIGVVNGKCKHCSTSTKFQPSNNMYPGDAYITCARTYTTMANTWRSI